MTPDQIYQEGIDRERAAKVQRQIVETAYQVWVNVYCSHWTARLLSYYAATELVDATQLLAIEKDARDKANAVAETYKQAEEKEYRKQIKEKG